VNIGQGSGAADDASTIDLSGTALANGAAISDWGGGIAFTTSAGVPIVTVGSVIDNLDFESRYDRFMYTTPTFGGFRAQVGFGQKSDAGETTEASIWWSGKMAGEIQAALGWSREKTGANTAGVELPDNEIIGGSVSWLHTSGLNLTFAYTQADLSVGAPAGAGSASNDASHYYTKVGYKFGPHAVSLGYFVGEDQVAVGDEAKAYAVGYVWTPIRWAEIYANYIMYSLDHSRPGVAAANDVNVAAIGTRIRF
jgi:predicted porin